MTTIIAEEEHKFKVGDVVKKIGGTYQADGIIVGIAVTTRSDVRYVFEFLDYPGMLHIFNGSQLEKISTDIFAQQFL
jgi:hypothetical protein